MKKVWKTRLLTRAALFGTALSLALGVPMGCAAMARPQLAAADSIDLLTAEVGKAIAEYAADLDACDDAKRRAVIEAYTDRIRNAETPTRGNAETDGENDGENSKTPARGNAETEAEIEEHKARFVTALERIDADKNVAKTRQQNAENNLETMQEIAGGLRRMALEMLKLDGEAKQYFEGLIEAQKRRNTETPKRQNEGTKGTGEEPQMNAENADRTNKSGRRK